MYRHHLLLFTVVSVFCLFHLSVCEESTMCMRTNQQIHLIMGCASTEMIHVYQAFYFKVHPGRSVNCGNPSFMDGDCITLAADTTEYFRSTCNGFGNCNRYMSSPSGVECQSAFDSSQLLIRVQYNCLLRKDPHDRDMAPVFPLMNYVTSHTGAQVHLRTLDYPSISENGNRHSSVSRHKQVVICTRFSVHGLSGHGLSGHYLYTVHDNHLLMSGHTTRHSCRIDLSSPVTIRMDVLDLYAQDTQGPDSGYCLYLHHHEPICAVPGSHYPLIYLNPGTDSTIWLWFWSTSAQNLEVRLWVLLSALTADRRYSSADSMTVTCGFQHGALQTQYATLPTPGPGLVPINSGGWPSPWSTSMGPGTTTNPSSSPPDSGVGIEGTSDESNMMKYVIIGAGAAGSLLVVCIIVIIALVCTKRKNRHRETNYDYICNANIAKATKLGATQGLDLDLEHAAVYSYTEDIKRQGEEPGVYAEDIQRDDEDVYTELPSLPASPISPYAICGNQVPWQQQEPEPYNEYTNVGYPGHCDVIAGDDTQLTYINNGYYSDCDPGAHHVTYDDEEPRDHHHQPDVATTTATLNAQRKNKLVADLEKLYAKPNKVRSDEAFIVVNDIYRG